MKKKKITWISGLLVLCLMTEPTAVVMAKAEGEVQETEAAELESEASTEPGISEVGADKGDKTEMEEKQKSEYAEETEIQPGERTATIVVVSITGNELTYYEVEDDTETEAESEETETAEKTETESEESESSVDADKKMKTAEKDTQTDDAETEDTEGTSVQKDSSMTPPGGMQQGDGMPQGDSSMIPSDGMPQGDNRMTPPDGVSQGDSNMTPPDGAPQGDGDSAGMPENMPSGDLRKGGRSEQQNTKTVYLPVPVVVHTDTDENRTFSILEAGDRLQVTIVTDEEGNETITEIWMLKE